MKICVYCGSSLGRSDDYGKLAKELANLMLQRGDELVYGGANVGLMGVVANTMLQGGGAVTGIIPKQIADCVGHDQLTHLHIVDSMHARKSRMFELSDGFIALPGGFGTLEELTEMLTWAQLGYHHKPCGLLNPNGYFDSLLAFLDHAVEEGFMKEAHRNMLLISTFPATLFEKFSSYLSPKESKWCK